MVRLKGDSAGVEATHKNAISIPYGSIKSVRADTNIRTDKISIPYGSIKRSATPSVCSTSNDFNSLWFD